MIIIPPYRLSSVQTSPPQESLHIMYIRIFCNCAALYYSLGSRIWRLADGNTEAKARWNAPLVLIGLDIADNECQCKESVLRGRRGCGRIEVQVNGYACVHKQTRHNVTF